jgi:hypothetical protein
MALERSDHIYDKWLEGIQKFDYFVLGVTLGLIGYLGANTPASALGWNVDTLQITSLAVLLLSAFCGLKRIASVVTLLSIMQRRLHHEESFAQHTDMAVKGGIHVNHSTGETLTPAAVHERTEKLSNLLEKITQDQDKWLAHTETWRACRDWLLIGGLSLIVFGRWLAAVQATLK